MENRYCPTCNKETESYQALEGTVNCIECFKPYEEVKPPPLEVFLADSVKLGD